MLTGVSELTRQRVRQIGSYVGVIRLKSCRAPTAADTEKVLVLGLCAGFAFSKRHV